jgi:hypothetical protein
MHADHLRGEEVDRLTEHPASASMPPTPHPTTPSPLIIVVCESVPTRVSGYHTPSFSSTPFARYSEIDLVHDADAGWHHAECLEGLLSPLQQLVALSVAFELEVEVHLQRRGGTEKIHLHRVVHDEIHRHKRLDHLSGRDQSARR